MRSPGLLFELRSPDEAADEGTDKRADDGADDKDADSDCNGGPDHVLTRGHGLHALG